MPARDSGRTMRFDPISLITDTARALGFLTRLPVPAGYFEGEKRSVAQSSGAFPLAGMIAALPAAALLALAPLFAIPPLLAAALAVLVQIVICGALHEDGLADAADGFFGGRDPAQRLAIMTDSRNGTYGTLALILSVALRIAALQALESGLAAALALLAAAAASRSALVWHWFELPSARPGGTADQAGKPDKSDFEMALLTGLPAALLLALLAAGLDGALLLAAFSVITAIGFVRLCRDKIGGHTGDTLGAAQQIAEISALTALAATV